MSSVSKLRKMTIDTRDIDKVTPQTKMEKLRKDSAMHEVIPGQGMSSYEKGIAIKKLRERYEEQNKTKTNPAGGFKTRFRKKSKSKRGRSKSKRGRSKRNRK